MSPRSARAAQAAGVDFTLAPRPTYDPTTNDSLQLGPQTEIAIEGLTSGTTLRRPFTFANRGKTLDGGLVHEPPAALGPGPFPILLIIYPGEAASWEGVSAPLAERGFVVVSYFPRRLLDLDGDLDDLRLLLNLTAAGKLSTRGDGSRLAIAGGSVSTVYTYLLAQTVASAPADSNVRAAVQYGGLFDLYAFRQLLGRRPGDHRPRHLGTGISARRLRSARHAPRDLSAPQPALHDRRDELAAHAARPRRAGHHRADRTRAASPQTGSPSKGSAIVSSSTPTLEHYLDISKRDPAQLDMLEQTVAFLHQWTGTK